MDNKIKKIKAFSLVELIVAVSISIMVMASVWVFVSSGLKNIFLQKNSISNSIEINYFSDKIYENFDNIKNSWSIAFNSSWILFERKKSFGNWWFSYIWVSDIDNLYCDDDSDSPTTKHIFIKNFIPFIENSDEISSFSGIYESDFLDFSWNKYKTLQKEHKLVDENGQIIIWKSGFWVNDNDIEISTWTYLNSPTGIASDWEYIYISDSLNDRVVYLSGNLVYTLLDKKDWLNLPTWLHYESNSLYISNSGNWEILKFSSEDYWNQNQTFSFSGVNETWVHEIFFEFLNNGSGANVDISQLQLSDIEMIDFDWTDDNYKMIDNENNIASYRFYQPIYSWASLPVNIIWKAPVNRDFNPAATYSFNINQITNLDNLEWNYSINLRIWDSYKSFNYFTNADDYIYTKNDNSLVIYNSWLTFPNHIWWIANNEFNEFDSSASLDIWYGTWDILLSTPIESIEISEDSGLLNLIIKYYQNYNCYNLDENKKNIRTMILKYSMN